MLAELHLPGLRVLDVGSGPGYLAAEMAAGGADVVGVDSSQAMLEMAAELHPGVRFQPGEATSLPFPEASFDLVCSTQVLEYVADIPAALAEFGRVLRPGGLTAILDTDWDSVIWAVADRPRQRRILDAWDRHVADPHLPARLAGELRTAGFQNVTCRVIPIVNLSYHPDQFGFGCSKNVEGYVLGSGLIEAEVVQAWLAELEARDAAGSYFFSLNRYLFLAQAP